MGERLTLDALAQSIVTKSTLSTVQRSVDRHIAELDYWLHDEGVRLQVCAIGSKPPGCGDRPASHSPGGGLAPSSRGPASAALPSRRPSSSAPRRNSLSNRRRPLSLPRPRRAASAAGWNRSRSTE